MSARESVHDGIEFFEFMHVKNSGFAFASSSNWMLSKIVHENEKTDAAKNWKYRRITGTEIRREIFFCMLTDEKT